MSNLTEDEIINLCEYYGYMAILNLCIVSLGGRRGYMDQGPFELNNYENEFNKLLNKNKKYQKLLGNSYEEIGQNADDFFHCDEYDCYKTEFGINFFEFCNLINPKIEKKNFREFKKFFPELNQYKVSQGTIFTLEKLSKKDIDEINSSENNIAKYIEYPCYDNWYINIPISRKYGYSIYLELYNKFKMSKIQLFGNFCPDKSKDKNHIEIMERIKRVVKSEESPLKNIIKNVELKINEDYFKEYDL